MAAKTELSRSDFTEILPNYNLGEYRDSRPITAGTVQINFVVLVPECAESDACLSQRGEHMHVQAFVAHGAVESFFLPILPRLAGINIQRLDAALRQPRLHRHRPTNSAPLSLRRLAGASCCATSAVSTPITRSAEVVRATSSASP
jgi:hypothetical protein